MNRVLYRERASRPGSPRDLAARLVSSLSTRSTEPRLISEGLWLQPSSSLGAVARKLGVGHQSPRATLLQLGFQKPIVLIDSLASLDLARRVQRSALIALLDPAQDSEDRLPDATGVDAVIYAGPFTAPLGQAPTIEVVPEGIDVAYLLAARDPSTLVPADLLAVPGPVIGLVGPVTRQIDLELILTLARRHTYWSFVLVGDLEADVSGLRDQSNILIFGARPSGDLPGYLKGLNVAMLPLRPTCPMDVRTIATLQQYRAAGVPAVVSGLTPGLSYSAVSSADGPAGFERAIECLLSGDTPSHSPLNASELQDLDWTAVLDRIEAIIARALPTTA